MTRKKHSIFLDEACLDWFSCRLSTIFFGAKFKWKILDWFHPHLRFEIRHLHRFLDFDFVADFDFQDHNYISVTSVVELITNLAKSIELLSAIKTFNNLYWGDKKMIFRSTHEYQINMQQILFKLWVLAHLHAYFVLHNSTEKNVVQNLFFYHLFTTYMLIWSTGLFGTLGAVHKRRRQLWGGLNWQYGSIWGR